MDFCDWRQWSIPSALELQNSLNFLLPLTGIFIALLALWAQLTTRIALVSDKNNDSRRKNATVALFWTYMAISIAVLALAIFGFTTQSSIFAHIGSTTNGPPAFGAFLRYLLYRIGLGLLLTSCIMFFAHVLESTMSLFIKVRLGQTLTSPLLKITNNEYRKFIKSLICMASFLGLFSIAGIVLGWRYPICFVLWIGSLAILLVALGKYLKRVKA